MTDQHPHGDIIKKQRCPYRRIFRNVHVRRAYLMFSVPIAAPITLITGAALGIKENMSDFFEEYVKVLKDGNSYD